MVEGLASLPCLATLGFARRLARSYAFREKERRTAVVHEALVEPRRASLLGAYAEEGRSSGGRLGPRQHTYRAGRVGHALSFVAIPSVGRFTFSRSLGLLDHLRLVGFEVAELFEERHVITGKML